MTMNAPAGPPICTFDPPSTAIRKPATIAVIRPCSGLTPLAMPKAMASGRATMPTVTPAMTSLKKRARSYSRSASTSRGRNAASGMSLRPSRRRVSMRHRPHDGTAPSSLSRLSSSVRRSRRALFHRCVRDGRVAVRCCTGVCSVPARGRVSLRSVSSQFPLSFDSAGTQLRHSRAQGRCRTLATSATVLRLMSKLATPALAARRRRPDYDWRPNAPRGRA